MTQIHASDSVANECQSATAGYRATLWSRAADRFPLPGDIVHCQADGYLYYVGGYPIGCGRAIVRESKPETGNRFYSLAVMLVPCGDAYEHTDLWESASDSCKVVLASKRPNECPDVAAEYFAMPETWAATSGPRDFEVVYSRRSMIYGFPGESLIGSVNREGYPWQPLTYKLRFGLPDGKRREFEGFDSIESALDKARAVYGCPVATCPETRSRALP